jgi:hypothetical protein
MDDTAFRAWAHCDAVSVESMTCVPVLDLNAIANADLPRANHAPPMQNLGTAITAV